MLQLFRRKRTAATGAETVSLDPAFGDPDGARLRQALRARDWSTARGILSAASHPDDFSFYLRLATEAQGCEEWLPVIVRAQLHDTLPLLVYGARAIGWAWDARSSYRAKYVGRDQFERLRIAEDCLQGVVRREPDNTAAWCQLIITARGLQLGADEARHRFDQAVARHPHDVLAHRQLLQQLCPKWGGSFEAVHNFVRRAVTDAPPGSPLWSLVPDAHLEEYLERGHDKDALRYMRSATVRASLHEAADRSVRHPQYVRRPGWPLVHNYFAAAFSLAGEPAAAAEQFRILGDLATDRPWGYIGGFVPEREYCAHRAAAFRATGVR